MKLFQEMIIAVDFDNTIAVTEYPFIKEIIPETVEWLLEQRKNGAKIILWTCREGRQLKYALDFCKENGLIFDAVNNNLKSEIKKYKGSNPRKINADIYLDDRNMLLTEIKKNE